jgi:phage/plasmid primase-like uncharacterized protein
MPIDPDILLRARATPIESEIARRQIKLRGGVDRCGPCPVCGGTDRFSINIRKQVWYCRGCGDGGDVIKLVMHLGRVDFRQACAILTGDDVRPVAQHQEPAKDETGPSDDKSDLARFLWSRSLPVAGSLVETYLKSRQCWLPSPSIRFLPGRGDHRPAMISRFGDGPGVHLTKLKSGGTGKAGTDKDKIMIGPSVGCPIVVSDNPDHDELLIAEGIEDAATLAIVTGWSAWAAGSADRIPHVVKAASKFERVFVAVDRDQAGARALANSRRIRRGVIPLHFAKTLDGKDRLDANKAMIRFGADAVLAAIEWCEAQASYRSGQIGFHAMQAAMQRANVMFNEMVMK